MHRIKMILEYDGTDYAGWQLQTNASTIQGHLEAALKTATRQFVRVTASGRTDAGVHARCQPVHCDVDEEWDWPRLQNALNGLLPKDIVVKDIVPVDAGFHARFDASKRTYRYYISRKPTAVFKRYSWHFGGALNFTLMQQGAEAVSTFSDFKSFCKTGSNNKTYTCSIAESFWYKMPREEMWVYQVSADRFLYGMVRALVGTLVSLGQGKITLQDFYGISAAGDRTAVPFSVPAQGLFLENVSYSKHGVLK